MRGRVRAGWAKRRNGEIREERTREGENSRGMRGISGLGGDGMQVTLTGSSPAPCRNDRPTRIMGRPIARRRLKGRALCVSSSYLCNDCLYPYSDVVSPPPPSSYRHEGESYIMHSDLCNLSITLHPGQEVHAPSASSAVCYSSARLLLTPLT